MLYLIGLGLNDKGISKEGMLAVEKCKKVYLEGYTVNFPYTLNELHLGKKKIIRLRRDEVESNKLIKEAKGRNIALLVYGSPLFATTHMTLILDAKEQKVRTEVIYSASVLDGIAETGLQLYKFGKIASIPAWTKNYKPDSFMDLVKDNQSIKAHSLILIDIGLPFERALEQLEEAAKNKNVKLGEIIICSQIGTENSRIFYDTITSLKKKRISLPFCIIIPEDMHFLEEKGLRHAL